MLSPRAPITSAHGTDIFATTGDPNRRNHERYSTTGDQWSTQMDVNTGVANAPMVTVGDKLYLSGGILASSNCTSKMQIYDVLGNSWSETNILNFSPCRHGAAMIGNKIWHTGGNIQNVFSWDVTDETEFISNQPFPSPQLRQFASVVAIGNTIYILGGQDGGGIGLANVDAYDTVNDTWSAETPMPVRRDEAAAVVADGKIYVLGGRTDNITTLDAVHIFDPSTHTWSEGPRLPEPLFDLGAGVVGNSIYAVGGVNAEVTTDNVYVLDL